MSPALHMSPRSPDIIVLGPHDNFGLRKQAFREKAMRMAAKSLPTVEIGDSCSETEEGDYDFSDVYEEQEQQDKRGHGISNDGKALRISKKSPLKPTRARTPPPPPPPEDEASPSSKKTTKMQKTGSTSGEKKIVRSSPKPAPKASGKKAKNSSSLKPVSSSDTADSRSSKSASSTSPSHSPTASPAPKRAPRKRVVIVKDPNQTALTAATTTSPKTRNSIRRSVSDDGAGSDSSLRKTKTRQSLPAKSVSLDDDIQGAGKARRRRMSLQQGQNDDDKAIQDKMAKLETTNNDGSTAKSSQQAKANSSNNSKDEKKGVFRAMRSKLFSSK